MLQVLPTRNSYGDSVSKSHPREWVDGSGAAYNRAGVLSRFSLSLAPRGREKRKPGLLGASLM